MHLKGKKVAVVGLGVSNLGLVRFLLLQGARVTVLDRKPAEELAGRLEEVRQAQAGPGGPGARERASPVRAVLGPGYLDALDEGFDVIFLTPGMPKRLPQVEEARRRGAVVSGEIPLFLELCPAPVVGITGSAGKTTTSTLVARMLEASGYQVYLGGNIGLPLIDRVDRIPSDARVVLELSSFQLELTGRSPHVGVLLNLLPDHMDVHSSWDEYVAAKRRVFLFQGPRDCAVLNGEDELVAPLAEEAPGKVLFFGERGPFPQGAWVEGGGAARQVVLRLPGEEARPVCAVGSLRLVGRHNLLNALAAVTAAGLMGAGRAAMAEVLGDFAGVSHRLERVAEVDGVLYVDDSIATTPDRARAALAALPGPLILIAGGYDKKLDFTSFARALPGRVRHLILMGATAPRIRAAVEQLPGPDLPAPVLHEVGGMAEAVELARSLARSGDTVLLSPACASFDMFRNYEERGTIFAELVRRMAGEGAS
ncbi:MAG: UDP-N-acetylmuramoyl-L-alanine--D-glutamate ligase [Bacillota bacterium]|nr:UDP-N-acetylmuramoyl-L-alanine--D-glutamate ligase [Bacillota bacterium]